VSYEINIIAKGQTAPSHFSLPSGIFVKNEKEDGEAARYAEIWPFFSSVDGIMYSVGYYGAHNFFSALEICELDSEKEIPASELSGWFPGFAGENLTPFVIRPKFYDDLEYVLRTLLEDSPQKTLLFQTRYQCEDIELIVGTFRYQDFIGMLRAGKVLFNACYVIQLEKVRQRRAAP